MLSLIVEVSTLYGLFTANYIVKKYYRDSYKVLLVSDNTKKCELNKLIKQIKENQDKFCFDKIVYLNELIYPLHPSKLIIKGYSDEAKNIIRNAIGIYNPDILLCESIQVSPSLFLANLYKSSELCVYADGVMCYSPTRFDLPQEVLARIEKVFYVPFIENVQPLLLVEASPEYIPIEPVELIPEFNKFGKNPDFIFNDKKSVVIVGQYLSDLNLLLPDEEVAMYIDILEKEYQIYGEQVNYVFRPHPSAASPHKYALLKYAEEKGIKLQIDDDYLPLECRFNKDNLEKISGVFSTSLFTMAKITDAQVQSYGCDEFYDKLNPWFNSNRVPVVLANIMFNSKYENMRKPNLIFTILALHSMTYNYKRFKDIMPSITFFNIPQFLTGYFSKINFISRPVQELQRLLKEENKSKTEPVDVKKLESLAEQIIAKKFGEQDKKAENKSKTEPIDAKKLESLVEQIIAKQLREQAKKAENKSKAEQPTDAKKLRILAEQFIAQGDYKKAAEYLKQAKDLLPNNKNCRERYEAVATSNSVLRLIRLKMSKKYEG